MFVRSLPSPLKKLPVFTSISPLELRTPSVFIVSLVIPLWVVEKEFAVTSRLELKIPEAVILPVIVNPFWPTPPDIVSVIIVPLELIVPEAVISPNKLVWFCTFKFSKEPVPEADTSPLDEMYPNELVASIATIPP